MLTPHRGIWARSFTLTKRNTSGPINVVPPTIAGSTGIGDLLTCTPGTWIGDPTPTYSYQWLRDGVPIAGEIGLTYTTVLADDGTTVTCREAASNAFGSGNATSNGLAISAVSTTNRLYTSDSWFDTLYELDPDTLLDISSGGVPSIGGTPTGIGGITGRLYNNDQNLNKIYELDLDTLLDISSGGVSSPDTTPTGIGGMDSRLYFSGAAADDFWEIDPDTFLALGAGVNAPVANPQGIGGTSTRLFAVTSVNADSYELDPDTLLASNTVSSPNSVPLGMGGISSRLYTCGYSPSRLYEIDPDTLLDISSGGVAGFGTIPTGIGGVK